MYFLFRRTNWLMPVFILFSLRSFCNNNPDSTEVITLLNRAHSIVRFNPDSSLYLSRKAFNLSTRFGYFPGQVNSLLCLGLSYMSKSNHDKALYFLNQALEKSKQIHFKPGEGSAHLYAGQLYDAKGKYGIALQECFEALEIFENTSNKKGVEKCNFLLSHIYYNQHNYKKAKEYILKNEKSLPHYSLGEQHVYYINLGSIYQDLELPDSAIYCFNQSLNIQTKAKNELGMADVFTNLGNILGSKSNLERALTYYMKALAIYEKLNVEYFMGVNYSNIGGIYLAQNKFDLAEKYLLKGLTIAKKTEDQEGILIGYRDLAKLYAGKKQFEKAHNYESYYIRLTDSLTQKENQNQINEILTKHVAYKKDKEIELLNNQSTIREQIIEKQKTKTFVLIWGLVVLLMLIVYIILSLTERKKRTAIITEQKAQVEKQKSIIEQKNKDITDSINYASRLQKAIVLPVKMIMEHLPQSFVIFRPKDIVAGDFYWMETVQFSDVHSQKDVRLTLIAAADCTGHGVPGAMMSLICANALNRAIKEFHLFEPGKILDKVRELVIETFEKSETEVKDGMDISLCAISSADRIINWSGANNPLWIIPKTNQNKMPELIEIKANKQPIGIVDNPSPFISHTLTLNQGDMIYLFTDGFADQFGGPDGKKYKYNRLKNLLLMTHNLSMSEQKFTLERDFLDWKSFNEQVDDVCVIGVRL